MSRIATLAIGVVGGLVVGMTSVGSGSLMIVMLLLLYPRMLLSDLVGTDLVQAIPLVASAALAHLIFGRFHLALTASILVGSVPGVFIGARLSARAPDHLIRPALLVVLTASGLKLLEPGNLLVGVLTGVVAIAGGARALAESQHAKRREFAPAAGTALPERSRPETRQRTAVPPG